MTPNAEGPLCPDWVYSNCTNVHIARDRGWFTTYTPLSSTISSIHWPNCNIPIHGIGTIHLRVHKSPYSKELSIIELTDVLHAPDIVCNTIGNTLYYAGLYEVDLGAGPYRSSGTISKDGEQIAYFLEQHPLFAVSAVAPEGKVLGQSMLKDGVGYMVSCTWDNRERKRQLGFVIS